MLTFDEIGPELPKLARQAIESWVRSRQRPEVSRQDVPPAPVFVTLRNPDGSLRGCIGTLVSTEPDVVRETVRSAILAATRDPRFPALQVEELGGVHVEVSVLLPEEPITSLQELDPKRYGVVVRSQAGRQGLLLPAIPGIDDVVNQVAIARSKAGMAPDEPASMSRFEVKKFEE